MPRKKKKWQIATFDLETDPFKKQRLPQPFCGGIYKPDNKEFIRWWGDDCIDQFISYLEETPDNLILYAHNGGKFDFWYLLDKGIIDENVKFINGRLVKCTILNGKHQLRDSLAIIPVSLDSYQKDLINYDWFEREHREKYKKEILDYLESDCVYLADMVLKFWDMFGDVLTIGAASIKELMDFHPFIKITRSLDELYRPYYYGGRVQCFEKGVIEDKLIVIDVNSMYPCVMSTIKHPVGATGYNTSPDNLDKLIDSDEPFFIHFTGTNKGVLPTRTKEGLDFTIERGEFKATSHEIRLGLKHGLIEIEEVHQLIAFNSSITFDKFVEHFMKGKIESKELKDLISELFYKLILNSAYGKTGQNPENFYDFKIIDLDELPPSDYEYYSSTENYEVWRKACDRPVYYDCAIAASVTGAARALLLDGLLKADRPLYCDTDSIICRSAKGLELHPTKLGAWDIEAEGERVYIAGKKLYAFEKYDGEYKTATKGVRLTPDQIIKVAKGETVKWEKESPTFNMLSHTYSFLNRSITIN
jgi:DNA polymerase elongation subunit (family B)